MATDDKPVPLLCSWRLGLAILAFLCFVHNYSQRMGMSVAIVCMVNHTALDSDEITDNKTVRAEDQCLANAGNGSSVNPEVMSEHVQLSPNVRGKKSLLGSEKKMSVSGHRAGAINSPFKEKRTPGWVSKSNFE